MLRTLNDLFESLRPARRDATPAAQEHALQLATAVLLVEVMRADATQRELEKPAVLAALREKFTLAEDELARLYELAGQRSVEALDDFAAAGYAQATLWVLAGNARAIRFYERAGWSPDGARKQDTIGDDAVTELRYRFRLTG